MTQRAQRTEEKTEQWVSLYSGSGCLGLAP